MMRRTLARLRVFIATLLIAVLVIAPVADAFTCGPEPATSHLTETGTDPHEDDDGADCCHGLCTQNHCHHHSTAVVAAAVTLPGDSQRRFDPALPDAAWLANVYDGLMRPPRS